jgi:hypothetical protein
MVIESVRNNRDGSLWKVGKKAKTGPGGGDSLSPAACCRLDKYAVGTT